MSTPVVIGLGLVAWVLLGMLLALFLGRVIQLRDRQQPHRGPPRPPATLGSGKQVRASSLHPGAGDRRNEH
ncbi:MAG TPA: hypothetical protein VFQ77_13730 [Pseudonocardiaceae bacterium]|jgi:hypothetical protein|nr:hypothetical protein [Pseudonocardiaceae bacterium]